MFEFQAMLYSACSTDSPSDIHPATAVPLQPVPLIWRKAAALSFLAPGFSPWLSFLTPGFSAVDTQLRSIKFTTLTKPRKGKTKMRGKRGQQREPPPWKLLRLLWEPSQRTAPIQLPLGLQTTFPLIPALRSLRNAGCLGLAYAAALIGNYDESALQEHQDKC